MSTSKQQRPASGASHQSAQDWISAHDGQETVASRFESVVARLDRRAPGGRGFGLRFWDGSTLPPTKPSDGAPTLHFTSPDGLVRIVRAPGELGFSRAWVSGELEVDGDLEQAMVETEEWRNGRINPGDIAAAFMAARATGLLRREHPAPPESEAKLNGRRHSFGRDKAAISHHYDVSNDFYRMMLGPTMVYSCAYFGSATESLEDAQSRKLDLVCQKLELEPGERLLDVGCGWGSLLIHAAKHYGTRAVGVTLSEEQATFARKRIRDEGLGDLCEVRVEDYRSISDGPYDKIASIGMFEHVGERNLWLYLARVRDLLSRGGLFLNHGIVRTAEAPMNQRGFTQRYVFPDGELHTQGHVIGSLEGVRFELLDDESLRPHYAQTLRCWAENLAANRAGATAEIGAEKERIWRLHNVGAALAFDSRRLSVHQTLLRPLDGSSGGPLRVRRYLPQPDRTSH